LKKILAALLGLTALAVTLLVAPGGASAYTSSTDVVFVHGYGACQDSWTVGAGPLQTQYYFEHEPLADLHAVSYYSCDTDGTDISAYGAPSGTVVPAAVAQTPDGDLVNTQIEHYSYELAWYLWDNFASQGKRVDLVGASMGGLVITYALQRVAAHDPAFPPSLVVPTVVTFATPFQGVNLGCTTTVECQEMLPGSPFISALDRSGAPQPGTGYTFWVIVGSSAGCDVVPGSSSTVFGHVAEAVNYSAPCYTHVGYLWDDSFARDASGTLNGKPFSGGAHSLALMNWALL
jgi:hypothetical protein